MPRSRSVVGIGEEPQNQAPCAWLVDRRPMRKKAHRIGVSALLAFSRLSARPRANFAVAFAKLAARRKHYIA
jgi:hypothetical protein